MPLFIFDFFSRQLEPTSPVSLCDCIKPGKIRGILVFLCLAKPVAAWSNRTSLERQQITSALEGVPANCSVSAENVLRGCVGESVPLSLVLFFTFENYFCSCIFFTFLSITIRNELFRVSFFWPLISGWDLWNIVTQILQQNQDIPCVCQVNGKIKSRIYFIAVL